MNTTGREAKPKILCLLGLSGSGKTTLEQYFKNLGCHKVTSHATREIRNGEVNGEDYYFISEEEFDRMDSNGEFCETGGKYGGRYAVSWNEISDHFANVLVTAKDGLDDLTELDKFDLLSIWTDCDLVERFVRIGERNNLRYALGRIEKDGFRRGQEIESVDYILDTTNLSEREMKAQALRIARKRGW